MGRRRPQALKAAQEGLRFPGGSNLSLSFLDRVFLTIESFSFLHFEELSAFLGIDSGTDLAF